MPRRPQLDGLRRGVHRFYRSPRLCLWFLRSRLLDSALTVAAFVWYISEMVAEAPQRPRPSFKAIFAPICMSCLACSCSITHLCAVMWGIVKASRHLEQGDAGTALSPVVCVASWALKHMLVDGMLFVFILTVLANAGMQYCFTDHGDWYSSICYAQWISAHAFVIWNWCLILVAGVLLSFEPPEVRQRQESASRGALGPEVIDMLQAHDYGDASAPSTQPTCSICLEDFSIGDKVRYLPCGHHFHARCVDMWLADKAACPLRCRNDLKAEARRRGAMPTAATAP